MILEVHNFDLDNVVTPVDWVKLDELLRETGYCPNKSKTLVEGFKNGFRLGYSGNTNQQDFANNHTLRVGTQINLWNKVIKEVQHNRYAGPFRVVPFDNFVLSPLGKSNTII